MSNFPLVFAFSAGLLASVNPCGFAMLPGFAAYYLGSKDGEGVPATSQLRTALILGVAATGGFMSLFVGIGAILSVGGQFILHGIPWLSLVIGVGLVVVGIWTWSGHTLPLPLPTLSVKRFGRGPQAMFLYGLVYGLASLGCALPVFLSVVAGALTVGGIVEGILMFVSYSLGMGTVLIAVALGAALLKGAVAQRLRSLLPYVNTASSAALVIAGLYLMYQAAINPL